MPEASTLERIERRMDNTKRRHQIIRKRFDEYYAKTVDGIRLDYDGIIKKVAEDFGYSIITVRKIMKGD